MHLRHQGRKTACYRPQASLQDLSGRVGHTHRHLRRRQGHPIMNDDNKQEDRRKETDKGQEQNERVMEGMYVMMIGDGDSDWK